MVISVLTTGVYAQETAVCMPSTPAVTGGRHSNSGGHGGDVQEAALEEQELDNAAAPVAGRPASMQALLFWPEAHTSSKDMLQACLES